MEQLRRTATQLGFHMSDEELEAYRELMSGNLAAYSYLDSLPDYLPRVRYPRTPGYRPTGAENLYGAWYRKLNLKGASKGKLTGRKIALKDNVCVAGVPLSGGSSILEGYLPEVDATIVTRILDAGGEIVGKAVCEYFSFSGGSHTSATGPVQNPRKPGYSAGGSSSGSAALVAAGEVEMAIGGDQGGSIRIPSSYCGTYGMKPTYGLVPYTGILSIEFTVDHTGPITANVEDNALLLEVLAGPDGIDPRQTGVKAAEYAKALKEDAKGLRVGVVKEGFGFADSEPEVDAKVREASERLKKCGAKVEEVSIPLHALGSAIIFPVLAEGGLDTMKGNGFGTNHKGLHVTSMMGALSQWRRRADEFSESLKATFLFAQFTQETQQGRFYAKAQNLGRQLRTAYDEAFEKFDLLVMPTTPMKATPLPKAGASIKEIVNRALEMLENTSPFNLTGHPAMSVPCGTVDGLPVGMMLVGKHFNESQIYHAAYAFEQSGNWQKF